MDDVISNVLDFQAPYIFTKLGSVFVPYISERTYMIIVSQFKLSVTQSDVCLFRGWCCYFSLVNNIFNVAISIHWTRARFSAVAFLILVVSACGFVNLSFVMVRYGCFDVAHAAVA